MTDVMSGMDQLTGPLKVQFANITSQIEDLDSQLNVEDASKTKLLNQAAKGVESDGEKLVSQVAAFINSYHGADRVGLITALRKSIQKDFAKEVDDFVEANVQKSDAPRVSDDEQAAIREKRRELVKMAQSLYGVLENFGGAEGLEKPSQLRGPTGKRGKTGPRLKNFQFSVNGDVVGSKLSDVQKRFELGSVGDVRVAVEAAVSDFDWAMPPESFDFVVKNETVHAEKVAGTNGSASSEEDEDDDDTSTEDDGLFSEEI